MKIWLSVGILVMASPVWAQSKPPVSRADPCAPIGRTADGKLVYSMKCDNLPVPPPAPKAENATPPAPPPEEEDKGGLFRNPFPSVIRPTNAERIPGVGPAGAR
jgi:hypothetical protein